MAWPMQRGMSTSRRTKERQTGQCTQHEDTVAEEKERESGRQIKGERMRERERERERERYIYIYI